jgi:hypothetical protein
LSPWLRPAGEIQGVLARAQAGDATAVPDVRALLARAGAADMLGGNLAREAVRALVDAYAGANLLLREALTRKLDEMRAELCGPNPTALERLLVERVVTTWLHLHHLEALYAGKKDMSLTQANYYQRAITAAQKRHVAAIKGLAEVRKLALPVLQVNVARKQVNVAAGTVMN